jgi:hypothetical protein
MATGEVESPFLSLSFFGTLLLCLASVFVFAILIIIAISTTQTTANYIISVAQTGAATLEQIGRSLIAQCVAVLNSTSAIVKQSGNDCDINIVNGLTDFFTTLGTQGVQLSQTVSNTFTNLSDALSEFSSVMLSTFLSTVQFSLNILQFLLIGVVNGLTILQVTVQSFVDPIIEFLNLIKSAFG